MVDLKLVRPANRDRHTAQTAGLRREAGISTETAGVHTIWLGYSYTPPGVTTGAHHHGDCETGLYILSGHLRLRFGDKLEKTIEAQAGDFVFVPPKAIHLEENLSETDSFELIVARGCTDMLVVNVPDPREQPSS